VLAACSPTSARDETFGGPRARPAKTASAQRAGRYWYHRRCVGDRVWQARRRVRLTRLHARCARAHEAKPEALGAGRAPRWLVRRCVRPGRRSRFSGLFHSLDAQHGLRLAADDHVGYIAYLLGSLRRLAGAGVDFAVLTANTPHLVFDELAALSSVPLLSIVETCAEEAGRQGLARLGLAASRSRTHRRRDPRRNGAAAAVARRHHRGATDA
jgi:hypothetical protein